MKTEIRQLSDAILQICKETRVWRVEAMESVKFHPGASAAIMESDENQNEIIREMNSSLLLSMEMMCASGDAIERKEAEGAKKAPGRRFTDPELIARGILYDVFLQATRWDNKYDFNADPLAAPECNVFDTHCHIDRLFGKRVGADRFNDLRNSGNRFYKKFEGCITSFCDPQHVEVRYIYLGDCLTTLDLLKFHTISNIIYLF